MDCVVVLAEVETAASSGVSPFPSTEGVQDMRLRVSIHVLCAQGARRFSPGSTEQNKLCSFKAAGIDLDKEGKL